MNTDKMTFQLAEGTGEIIIREGQAPKLLDPKAPLDYEVKGLLSSVPEFLRKRLNTGQFEQKDCTIFVNRENVRIALVFNERDEYNIGKVTGALQFHPDFASLCINKGCAFTPMELAQTLKMHRYWFTDRAEGMKLISTLMNYKADINQKVEQSADGNGNRSDIFTQVVNSNLPKSITLNLPIFKGYKPQPVEIEFFAKVDGRDVSFLLISPGANEALEAHRDEAIDAALGEIRDLAPEIAIIEE